MNEGNIGAIILAAGASTRLGEPKQLLRFEGSNLLRRACDAALASRCEPVVAVLGANAAHIAGEVESLPVLVAHSERWSEGMSTSVRVGLEALEARPQELAAAENLPCDQPHLRFEILNGLIDAHHASRRPIVVSEYEGVWGVPMLFARALGPDLRALSGSRGAQSVARLHAEQVECVPFPLGALDIDTREGYERLLWGAP